MTKVEILKLVKEQIKSKRGSPYICDKIDQITHHRIAAECAELKQWISYDLLGGSFSYDRWLKENHLDVWFKHAAPYQRWDEARLEWLDWMIKFWEAK